jgi:serine/threonine-protein kinase
MYCDNCGAENRTSAKFCYKCGTDFTAIAATEELESSPAVNNLVSPLDIDESTSPDLLNSLLNGRYQLKELLGRGGMGTVYRAHDNQLGMDVAIKFLLSRYTHDFCAIDSLKREARAAMRLSHPNIARLYNFEDTAQLKYLLMEYIPGESLAAVASKRTGRRLSEPEVIRYMCEICSALSYAHSENIIHRDIKPSNILLTTEGRVKLADFGIALVNEKAESEPGETAGTPSYMSPEQILGQGLDGRSDIYSLGVSMYEMLAGRLPFRGKDTSFKYISMLPDPIEGISDWLNAIIVKCLRKEPSGRWSTAEELGDVLSGRKEGGLGLKAKFQPWWIIAEELRKNEPVKNPTPVQAVKSQQEKRLEPTDYKLSDVQRISAPISSARARERLEQLERYAGLAEHASEREQARMAYTMTGGILAGLLFFLIAEKSGKIFSHQALLQLSFALYGASLGLAIGLAHKKIALTLPSTSCGILGGIIAGLILKIIPGEAELIEMQNPLNLMACGAVLGLFVGMGDGIYRMSLSYLFRCSLWGAAGGAGGAAIFLLIRYLFSSFWTPLPNWIVLGAALGFAIVMGIGLARKPSINL